ncbi:uncharacterized protein LOC124276524 [Haliotis rubra]|uniref:uncharacterized protein LOC124276524 n=1 Tax=Haliotis rubra TaxID=36100 RepID=UPI001EE58C0E|nr:uncharacterized protein LOC124276524 [Haliotis rubra]
MNEQKYKHVVRAFLSSMSATEFVSGGGDDTLWFLTHKQFCILTENIDHTEVHVDTVPASGGRVLSLTVTQRLQKLGRTLLISDDDKLIKCARNHNIDCKNFNDLGQIDLAAEGKTFYVVVYEGGEHCSSQVPHLPQLLAAAQSVGFSIDRKDRLRMKMCNKPHIVWPVQRQDTINKRFITGSLEVEDVQQTYHVLTRSKTRFDCWCHKEEDVQQHKRLSSITRPDDEVKRKRQVEQVVVLKTGETF